MFTIAERLIKNSVCMLYAQMVRPTNIGIKFIPKSPPKAEPCSWIGCGLLQRFRNLSQSPEATYSLPAMACIFYILDESTSNKIEQKWLLASSQHFPFNESVTEKTKPKPDEQQKWLEATKAMKSYFNEKVLLLAANSNSLISYLSYFHLFIVYSFLPYSFTYERRIFPTKANK